MKSSHAQHDPQILGPQQGQVSFSYNWSAFPDAYRVGATLNEYVFTKA